MENWSLNLGMVSLWNEEDEQFHDREMVVSFDSSDQLPFEIKFLSEDIYKRSFHSSKHLLIINRDAGFTIVNDDIFIILSSDQKERLFTVQGKWEYKPLKPIVPALADRIPSSFAKDFGVVFFYDYDNEKFTLANLMIDFDWNCSEPIILFIRTYDDERFPSSQTNAQYSNLNYNYEGLADGLSHYTICDYHFLLTAKQVEFLEDLAAKLSQ